jgi:DNA adenine methylase
MMVALGGIKKKFLLSSYPNEVLDEYRLLHDWYSSDMVLSASRNSNKRKIEALTANYVI